MSPRLYYRDSGLLHVLLQIASLKQLLHHQVVGKSWEGFVIESIINTLPSIATPYFYRGKNGEEIDLLIHVGMKELVAVDIKLGDNPHISSGFHAACKALNIQKKYIICSRDDIYRLDENTQIMPLLAFLKELPSIACKPISDA